jgi:type II secretory pathway component GspD/PulD (secretin)
VTTDPRIAALAEALRVNPGLASTEQWAAAILGERGMFLPDGLPYWATRAEATIATLRETLASERERITEEVEALAQHWSEDYSPDEMPTNRNSLVVRAAVLAIINPEADR